MEDKGMKRNRKEVEEIEGPPEIPSGNEAQLPTHEPEIVTAPDALHRILVAISDLRTDLTTMLDAIDARLTALEASVRVLQPREKEGSPIVIETPTMDTAQQ